MSAARRMCALLVAAFAVVSCGESDRAVDPDGHDHEARKQSAPPPDVAIAEVVGAVAGVPSREALRTLERWLHASTDGQRLLNTWPRRIDGTLDHERAPVRLAELEASIGPGSKSKCGEVTAVFNGEARVALRMRLAVPATAKECRGRLRASRMTGAEAEPFLRAAIADARVPDGIEIEPTPVAQN